MSTSTEQIKVGDRFIYTSPAGREIEHTVTAVDVPPKYQHKPGNCVRLTPVAGSSMQRDSLMWPDDLLTVEWMRRVDESEGKQ